MVGPHCYPTFSPWSIVLLCINSTLRWLNVGNCRVSHVRAELLTVFSASETCQSTERLNTKPTSHWVVLCSAGCRPQLVCLGLGWVHTNSTAHNVVSVWSQPSVVSWMCQQKPNWNRDSVTERRNEGCCHWLLLTCREAVQKEEAWEMDRRGYNSRITQTALNKRRQVTVWNVPRWRHAPTHCHQRKYWEIQFAGPTAVYDWNI